MLVHVTLLPLAGGVPIEVAFGTYTVTISPAVHDMAPGSAVQYVATVTGLNNVPVENPVLQWASLNPGVAAVDEVGLTEGLYAGETTIIVSYEGIAAASTLAVAETFKAKLGFTHSFSTDAQGWTVINAASSQPTHHTAGGNPDGYISATNSGSNAAWYWRAPADFHGDLTRYSLPELVFDLIQPGAGVSIPGDDVILEGSTLTLVHSIQPPTTTWTSYAISLTDPTGWVNRATGLPASRLQLIAAAANATSLQIRGRYHEGALTGGLDNPGIPVGKKVP
jgi:hypothetical protein